MQAIEHPTKFGVIIGAMKAGTTSLFRALSQYSDACLCRRKEPEFFESKEFFERGNAYYLSLFHWDPSCHKVAIEASTQLAKAPDVCGAPARMASTHWDFRFVYVVRNPIARIRSHYVMAYSEGYDVSPIFQQIDPQVMNINRYHFQLTEYLRYFSKERILVIRYEDLSAFPSATITRVARHLGLAELPHVPTLPMANSTVDEYEEKARQRVKMLRDQTGSGPSSFEGWFSPSRLQEEKILGALKSDYEQLEKEFGVRVHGT